MNDVQKAILTASGVTLACLSVYAGSAARNRVDIRSSSLRDLQASNVLHTWLASRQNEVNVDAVDYYSEMVKLLKDQYVEPIRDDEKLAVGSVRGMIASLADPRSFFMDKDEFKAYQDRQDGTYAGIGVDLYLDGAKTGPNPGAAEPPPQDAEEAVARQYRFPRLVVGAVVPGSNADKAGLKPGDRITAVDGHWIVDQDLLDKFRTAQKDYLAKKITFAEIAPLRHDLQKKTERALLPFRALQRLLTGTSGTATVGYSRAGVESEVKIAKGQSQMPGFHAANGVIRLTLTSAAVEQLKKAISGRHEVEIDLRNEPEGSFDVMRKCLDQLAKPGTYGAFLNQRHEGPAPLTVTAGNPTPPKINLLVDQTTRGPAEILALALSTHAGVTLKGQEMNRDRAVYQTVELPDGSGYVLVTSEYSPTAARSGVLALKERR